MEGVHKDNMKDRNSFDFKVARSKARKALSGRELMGDLDFAKIHKWGKKQKFGHKIGTERQLEKIKYLFYKHLKQKGVEQYILTQ